MGNRSGRNKSGSTRKGSTAAPARAHQSATPSEEPTLRNSNVNIRVNFNGQGARAISGSLLLPVAENIQEGAKERGEIDEQEEDNGEVQEEVPAVAPTRKSGRVVKKTLQDDFIFGSEFDQQLESSPVWKADDEEDENGFRSSPREYQYSSAYPESTTNLCTAQILSIRKPSRPRGRPTKNTVSQSWHHKVDDSEGDPSSDGPSSNTFAASSPQRPRPLTVFTFEVDDAIYEIINILQGSAKTQIDLPDIDNVANPGTQLPYSATFLTHLYIVCYHAKQWNLCDLVADTWIRAFHKQRKKGERSGKIENMLWRPNAALASRGKRGYDETAPEYKLKAEDPVLNPNVTDFDNTALSELYDNTPPDCGARFLWADAMALCGDKLEKVMERTKWRGQSWHPDLLHNIMCTSLRLVRRKLTLKIEEHTEGAWCNRYHEHTKHNLPCYRALASGRPEEGDVESEDELDAGDLEAIMMEELGGGTKRGFGDVNDSGAEMSPAKRVRFGGAEKEVIDVDAEGESEED